MYKPVTMLEFVPFTIIDGGFLSERPCVSERALRKSHFTYVLLTVSYVFISMIFPNQKRTWN